MTTTFNSRVPFILILAAGMGVRCLLACAHTTMDSDEFQYARMAQSVVGARPGGYPLSQPILFPLLLVASHPLVPDWEWAGRALSLLCVLGLLVILPRFSKDVFGSAWAGVGAALTVAFYPLLVDLGSRPMTEPLYDFFLVLAAWQTWRTMGSEERTTLFRQALLMGLALGLTRIARREGLLYLPLLSGLLFVTVFRRSGFKTAFTATGLSSLVCVAILLGSRLVVAAGRPVPDRYLDPSILTHLGGMLVLPMLAPALLFLVQRRPGDRQRLALFGVMLLPGLVMMLFPDPARKATALIPFIALMASEGCRRLGNGRPARACLLQGGVVLWLVVQGVSAPMRPHFVPPWRDHLEDRQAGEWLRTHTSANDRIAAFDSSISYYACLPNVRVEPAGSLEDFVAQCHQNGATYVVVDRRRVCRSFAVLDDLGSSPGDRPGLALVGTFPLHLNSLNRLLAVPLSSRGLHPDERAVVYRLTGTEH